MSKKWVIAGISVLVLIIVLAWLFIESTKPLPGETFAYNCDKAADYSKLNAQGADDKCRLHVPDGTQINYPTNPPSFGPHYPDWITKGFFDEPRPDGNLVHSMEHGYVIFWYDCEKKIVTSNFFSISNAYAQGLGMTGSSSGSPSASLKDMPKAFSDGSCDNLKNGIKEAIKKNGDHKIIAVPRTGMDYPLILTAWKRMEKLNSVDQNKIKEFIDTFRDEGPERTDEP